MSRPTVLMRRNGSRRRFPTRRGGCGPARGGNASILDETSRATGEDTLWNRSERRCPPGRHRTGGHANRARRRAPRRRPTRLAEPPERLP